MNDANLALLAPAAVLVLWTLIILLWTAVSRFQAMAKVGANLKTAKPGGRGQDLDGVLPDVVNWKSHNHTHLHEQPTLFYAAILILCFAGAASETAVLLAWAYVALRIIHSLWQALVNTIPVRFSLFLLSSVCLIALAIMAVRATLGH